MIRQFIYYWIYINPVIPRIVNKNIIGYSIAVILNYFGEICY
jgi:hypothetical protein